MYTISSANLYQVRKTTHENFHFVHLLSFFLSSINLTQKLHCIVCMQILPIQLIAMLQDIFCFGVAYELPLASLGLKTVFKDASRVRSSTSRALFNYSRHGTYTVPYTSKSLRRTTFADCLFQTIGVGTKGPGGHAPTPPPPPPRNLLGGGGVLAPRNWSHNLARPLCELAVAQET